MAINPARIAKSGWRLGKERGELAEMREGDNAEAFFASIVAVVVAYVVSARFPQLPAELGRHRETTEQAAEAAAG